MSTPPPSRTRHPRTDHHLSPKDPAMPLYDYDDLDFEARDEIDNETDDAVELIREQLTGLPARPGVRR